MPTYSTPGVYVNEGTLATLNASVIGTTAAVFFGEAERGPSTPTLINDWPTYRTLFGDLKNAYDLGYSVYHYFANGGRSCYVVRVTAGQTGTAAAEADSGVSGVPFYPRGYLSADATVNITDITIASGVATAAVASHSFAIGDTVTITDSDDTSAFDDEEVVVTATTTTSFSFATAVTVDETSLTTVTGTVTAASRVSKAFDVSAASVGTWGDGLVVTLVAGSSDPSSTSHGTFTLILTLDGAEVERWVDLSLDPDNSRYVSTIVNTYSKFITLSNVSTASATGLTDWNNGANGVTTALSGGDNGTVVTTDKTDAHSLLSEIRGNLILNHVGETDSTVIGNLITVAEDRGDSLVIIDPDADDEAAANVLTAMTSTVSTFGNSAYACQYAPRLKMIDPAKSGPGALRDTYPCGAVAGVIARTEAQNTTAKAPAGYGAEVRGALGLTVPMSNDAIGTLYDNNPSINSFKAVGGAGVVVYGARTFARTNPDKFIPVRRTLNYLKNSLKDLTEFAVFQPNDPNLWGNITSVVSSFLGDFYRKGGLKGVNANQSFFVRCNATNNTAATIDQGIVNVEVGVALLYPAEFIVINLSQWSGGSNAVETL